jgi:predicted nucleic acid-binding protein
MKTYWDSSALIEAVYEPRLLKRLQAERGLTRPHALAEVFSVLTGNPESRLAAEDAAQVVENLAGHLHFVELSAPDVLTAMKSARKFGVLGGRIHDFLHAVAAEKGSAVKILTLDKNDFSELTAIEVEVV